MNWTQFSGRTIYLDANIFIYALEEGSPYTGVLQALLQQIESGSILAVTSELTLAEVLVRPLRRGATEQVNDYTRVLTSDTGVRTTAVSRQLLVDAAGLRAALNLKLADAIHMATALHSGCDLLLSNDREMAERCPPPIAALLLSALP